MILLPVVIILYDFNIAVDCFDMKSRYWADIYNIGQEVISSEDFISRSRKEKDCKKYPEKSKKRKQCLDELKKIEYEDSDSLYSSDESDSSTDSDSDSDSSSSEEDLKQRPKTTTKRNPPRQSTHIFRLVTESRHLLSMPKIKL